MLTINNKNLSRIGVFLLITLMALTRVHHFGDGFSLPDASLAVFFLMGLLTANRWLLGFLLIEAGLLDFLAIDQFGVSDWCMSPGYWFLIPTYATLWIAGRLCRRFDAMTFRSYGQQAGILTLATSMAFLISNGSFYLFSGRFGDISAGRYFYDVSQYYPAYTSATLFYATVLIAAATLLKMLLTAEQDQASTTA